MLRASSEMAVAIRVASPGEKLSATARERPFWRATTMSWSEQMETWISSSMCRRCSRPGLEFPAQIIHPLFEIERSLYRRQTQPQLHHREGDFGLDADDHGLRSTELDHVRGLLQD